MLFRSQKSSLLEKMRTYYRDQLDGKSFAMWGLSFKPETNDVRESPALVMIEALLAAGATVRAYDPKAIDETKLAIGNVDGIEYCDSYYGALDGSDALIISTEWSFFLNPDFDRMTAQLNSPVIFDGRNIYDPAVMQRHGFDYFSIGRQPVMALSSANSKPE
mgnify:CR=1 FL=1